MTNQRPGFYARTRKRKGGRVVTYYFMDRRAAGLHELCLGSDFDRALAAYEAERYHTINVAGTIEEALAAWEAEVLPTHRGETAKGYAKNMKRLRPVFGAATWDAVTLVDLRGYLKARTGKTQANREISLLGAIWNWARLEGYTDLPWPAAGLKGSRWKNPERARTTVPTDEVFAAIYAKADQVVRDCMDLATATGMRLTDCRTVLMPRGDVLHLEASKTGKPADFDLSLSEVLPQLLARRRASRATHLMLLSTPTGRPVSARMLRERWDTAREDAAKAATDEALAAAIRATWLRDMRKRASWLADDLDAAAELLQHSSKTTTAAHYPTKRKALRPVR